MWNTLNAKDETDKKFFEEPLPSRPGLHFSAVPWLHELASPDPFGVTADIVTNRDELIQPVLLTA